MERRGPESPVFWIQGQIRDLSGVVCDLAGAVLASLPRVDPENLCRLVRAIRALARPGAGRWQNSSASG